MPQEGQELLVSVSVLAEPGHASGRHLQSGEQGGRAVPDVVVGALLGVPGLHRQRLLGPVQRLDLGLLVHAQHHLVPLRPQIQIDHDGYHGLRLYVARLSQVASAMPTDYITTHASLTSRPRTSPPRSPAAADTARPRRRPWPPAPGLWRT